MEKITYSVASPLRALLTECLPYELPLDFNSNWLYQWINNRAVSVSTKKIIIRPESKLDLLILSFLMKNRVSPTEISKKKITISLDNDDLEEWRAPASFHVRRDRVRTRKLDILALQSQLAIAALYQQKKDLILFWSRADDSSLRFPSEVNHHGKHLRKEFRENNHFKTTSIATSKQRLGTYNSFFVYEDYPFIGSFYNSTKWRALEAKWTFMRRLDVANCFGSIYTHSFAWSVGSENFNKNNLDSFKKTDNFGYKFDSLMQRSNWGETHGIPVGPEASRIFAEIIFQAIDRKIKQKIAKELSNRGIKNSDFEFLRYVDDYFIYSNDKRTLDDVSSVIEDVLKERNFSINGEKTADLQTPFTSHISSSKVDLKFFLDFSLNIQDGIPNFETRDINVHLKKILIESNNETAAVGSAISIIERKLRKFIKNNIKNYTKDRESAEEFLAYVWEFVYGVFTMYLSHPSVASCIKVIRMLRDYNQIKRSLGFVGIDGKIIELIVSNNITFAINKSVQRLPELKATEIEICQFLSLASALDIDLTSESRSFKKLKEFVFDDSTFANMTGKSNHAKVLLFLVFQKYIFTTKTIDIGTKQTIKEELLVSAEKIAETIYSHSFLPLKSVRLHAIQEVYLLSIVTSPYLSQADKERILLKEGIISMIHTSGINMIDATQKLEPEEFFKQLIAENDTSQINSKPGSNESIFFWETREFDTLLYEKEPQFVY